MKRRGGGKTLFSLQCISHIRVGQRTWWQQTAEKDKGDKKPALTRAVNHQKHISRGFGPPWSRNNSLSVQLSKTPWKVSSTEPNGAKEKLPSCCHYLQRTSKIQTCPEEEKQNTMKKLWRAHFLIIKDVLDKEQKPGEKKTQYLSCIRQINTEGFPWVTSGTVLRCK